MPPRDPLKLTLGVKSDPILYRYSFPWLLRLMADHGVQRLQLGSFFEAYDLPESFFHGLREQADGFGVQIDSVFTAHRELGGFFREEPGFEQVARRRFEKLIDVAAAVGANRIGSNPGAVLRDRFDFKATGLDCYLRHFEELMGYARERGVEWLTIEPMSCLAEPPTLPQEIHDMGARLDEVHRRSPQTLARPGFCGDISHGYADAQGRVVYEPLQLLEATLPQLCELHLKNTDAQFNSTFGFDAESRKRGIIDVAEVIDWLHARAEQLPVTELVCYLEIGGPKLGRDYSDRHLRQQLADSLEHLREVFAAPAPEVRVSAEKKADTHPVQIAPSMMCADQLNMGEALRRLEAVGVDQLHLDLMDGRFAANLSMGLPQIAALREATDVALDAHLMVNEPDWLIHELHRIGVDQVSVHAEACTHLDRTLTLIRDLGMRAGLALNTHTPLSALDYLYERFDYVLIMTVNPGFAGQKLTPGSFRKIRETRAKLDAAGCAAPIQVDGNVSFANVPEMVAAGADMLVAGTSSLFHAKASFETNAQRLRDAIREGLQRRAGSRSMMPERNAAHV